MNSPDIGITATPNSPLVTFKGGSPPLFAKNGNFLPYSSKYAHAFSSPNA